MIRRRKRATRRLPGQSVQGKHLQNMRSQGEGKIQLEAATQMISSGRSSTSKFDEYVEATPNHCAA